MLHRDVTLEKRKSHTRTQNIRFAFSVFFFVCFNQTVKIYFNISLTTKGVLKRR